MRLILIIDSIACLSVVTRISMHLLFSCYRIVDCCFHSSKLFLRHHFNISRDGITFTWFDDSEMSLLSS